ncbi:hypothetical protein [Mucilaginibacter segetis]|uniref:Uncharacterized protein n=1 Tax=Mucilaginibacter segetis TaxID=2793071 RepID=A0A934PQU1_9SPHI|nr:hypothetical protein [Mucilaginibacter segetis]MBK0379068.1 hypothetical protein [Mucilaginibacter segetis]
MEDTNKWEIDISTLKCYKKPSWTKDYFSETIDERYGVYIYNINEWRMMCYAGLIAIYAEKDNPKPLANSAVTWVWYDTEKTYDYAPLSGCLIFRKPAYKENSSKPDFPFILFKPTEQLFGFLEWNFTSIYYGFREIEKGKLVVKEIHPKDLDNLSGPKRTNEIIDINAIAWFDIKDIDNALAIYHGETK